MWKWYKLQWHGRLYVEMNCYGYGENELNYDTTLNVETTSYK